MKRFEYMDKVHKLLNTVYEKNEENILILARKIAENIKNDKLIHTFGTGHSHMIGIELFVRAGGLGNVDAILDANVLTAAGARRSGDLEKISGLSDVIFNNYNIENGDMMIICSNSGRNAMPIEMAQRCKKEGVFTVAITNLEQSKQSLSRHHSGKKLYECADLVLDNCVPFGDALLDIDGIQTGPGSSISSMFILNTAVSEAIRICKEEGIEVYVFQSQNVDGFNNDKIYDKYRNRVKHI